MRISLIGTRGVPARYGGFETAVEEVGRRMASSGHEVTVYCRGEDDHDNYLGMRLVHLPYVRRRSLETLSHTALSIAHDLWRGRSDVAIVFNAANSVFVPLLRLRRTPVATHVDGLEWQRGKWGPWGRRYYRLAEALAVRWSDRLIADAQGISDYYTEEFGAKTDLIAYGAPLVTPKEDKLHELGLQRRRYHLVVARFEPENHVDVIIRGYLRSRATHPLIVVGSAPYATGHVKEIESLAASDPRVHLLGGVWDQDLLDQLYANAATYLHGHSVGGTNPSLLRAMGAGSPVLAYDVTFNREVLDAPDIYFSDAATLTALLERAETDPKQMDLLGDDLRLRAASAYTWDRVAKEYEQLCEDLARRQSQRGQFSGRRSDNSRPSVHMVSRAISPLRDR